MATSKINSLKRKVTTSITIKSVSGDTRQSGTITEDGLYVLTISGTYGLAMVNGIAVISNPETNASTNSVVMELYAGDTYTIGGWNIAASASIRKIG